MADVHDLTVSEIAVAIGEGRISPVVLVQALLNRIDRLEPTLRAWVTLDAEGALESARQAERDAASMDPAERPLHGVPFGLKDIYFARGLPATACFPPFQSFVPDRDAVSVARLKGAGAILLGKTVTTQFAAADPSPTRNPWNQERTPGGSSSGSAVAVASRMTPFAIGSQTAGSILRPAAYCGVVGLKPTHNLIDATDVFPLAWSLDHVGPMARSVADVRLVLGVLAGTTIAPSDRSHPPRIGLLGQYVERANGDVAANVDDSVRVMRQAGASVIDLPLPVDLDLLAAIHRVTMQSEVAAVHAQNVVALRDQYSPRIRAEAMVGQLIPVAYYLHAQRLRTRAYRALCEVFERVDLLLLPTASNVAPPLETTGDPSFQAPWSLFGMPSISLPSGVNADGLPFGVQLVALRGSDSVLLNGAAWCEQVLGFNARPPIV